MFKIVYHESVIKEDISKLSPQWAKNIRGAVEKKLSAQPHHYGKPLRKSLKGYWKLRVGDYRIVYSIDGKQVKILAILHRSIVYANAEKRVKK